MRNSMCGAEFISQLIAAEAMASFQRARRIVQAGVNGSAIPRARAHADFRKRFQNEDVGPARRERTGNRAPHDATADDYYAGLFHGLQCIRTSADLFMDVPWKHPRAGLRCAFSG